MAGLGVRIGCGFPNVGLAGQPRLRGLNDLDDIQVCVDLVGDSSSFGHGCNLAAHIPQIQIRSEGAVKIEQDAFVGHSPDSSPLVSLRRWDQRSSWVSLICWRKRCTSTQPMNRALIATMTG